MKIKYITKFDYGNTRGYQVRVPTVCDGGLLPYTENTNIFFKKGTGTWKKALEAAKIWREKYFIKYDIERLVKLHKAKNVPMVTSSNNSSGVIGVTLQTTYKLCGTYEGYKGYWNKDGKQFTKQFSVGLYGECEAFLKACRFRFKHAGILIITDQQIIPCWPDVEYEL